MTAFTLKIIALTTMILDHAAIVFPRHIPLEFRAVGRLAWPIFAYLLAEGFRHTKDPNKFLLRLGVLALISQVPYSIAIAWTGQQDWQQGYQGYQYYQGYVSWVQSINFTFTVNTNIFFTLFLGGAAIVLYKRIHAKGYKSLAYIGAILPSALSAELLTADYGGMGVLFIFAMYIIADRGRRLVAMVAFSSITVFSSCVAVFCRKHQRLPIRDNTKRYKHYVIDGRLFAFFCDVDRFL